MKKSNLDERQEQILLRIEHNGFWLAFWLLIIAMVVQNIASGSDFRLFAGECAILLIISLYVAIECIRNGIWDRTSSFSHTAFSFRALAAVLDRYRSDSL